MYDSLLVPIDGSDHATAAAEDAIALAERFDASLSLLSVVESEALSLTEPAPENPDRETLDEQTRAALDHVESLAADAGVHCWTTVTCGTPHGEIEARVDEEGIDLVAMGTHGRTGLRRYLLGSVTERVLRTCDVPVYTIEASDLTPTVDTVLFPTDGSTCADAASRHALEIADQFDATVHALSVVDVQALAGGYDTGAGLPEIVESIRAERQTAVDAIHDRAADRDLDCETTVQVGAPDVVIREYADEHDADLITMGTHGHSGLDRVLLGSVAERTIRTSDAGVLAVPGSEE